MKSYFIISRPHNEIRKYLEYHAFAPGVNYRLSTYVLTEDVPEGTLYYSSLTGSLILVQDYQQARDVLIEEHILVPEETDERTLVERIRRIAQAAPTEFQPCRDYWILTTTSCNARCLYCFESKYHRATMSIETANIAAKFIAEHSSGLPIVLHWYGGEPLMNRPAIDAICHYLSEIGYPFRSEITTNGWYLTPDLATRTIEDWHLDKVLVTVDGTADVYNRIKAYVNVGNENPFRRVMANIDNIVNLRINVLIRTNIGPFNMYDTPQLYEYITARYIGRENVSIYPHLVSNPPDGDLLMDNDCRSEIYNLIRSVKKPWRGRKRQTILQELPGFYSGKGHEFSGEQIVIKPDGELAVNPDLFEEDHFGSVQTGFRPDENRLQEYLVEEEKTAICDTCPIFPTCFKRKVSFTATICTPADLTKCLDTSRKNMMALYDAVKENGLQ